MSVVDIGVPGQPMNAPPLTPWQAAVRDALDSSDVTVDQRITAAFAQKLWIGQAVTAADSTFTIQLTGATFTAPPLVFLTGAHGSYRVIGTVVSVTTTQVTGLASVSPDGITWAPSGAGFPIHVLAVDWNPVADTQPADQ